MGTDDKTCHSRATIMSGGIHCIAGSGSWLHISDATYDIRASNGNHCPPPLAWMAKGTVCCECGVKWTHCPYGGQWRPLQWQVLTPPQTRSYLPNIKIVPISPILEHQVVISAINKFCSSWMIKNQAKNKGKRYKERCRWEKVCPEARINTTFDNNSVFI